MSTLQMLRALVDQRLTAAVEEIFVVLERTIAEYEAELSRTKEDYNQLLDAVFKKHQVVLHRTDVQQPPHIKEEEEEVWISQEGQCLLGQEEADVSKFPLTVVSVKTEEHEDKAAESSQLHHSPNVQQVSAQSHEEIPSKQQGWSSSVGQKKLQPTPIEEEEEEELWEQLPRLEEVNDEDDIKSEPDSIFAPLSDMDHMMSDSSDHSDHIQKPLTSKNDTKGDTRHHTNNKHFDCSQCGKSFRQKSHFTVHMRIHTGEKPFTCSVCKKSFPRKHDMTTHMRTHTGEKPFPCSVCKKSFPRKHHVTAHMRTHTLEKPFNCSVCKKSFPSKPDMTRHMRIHTGEKPFACSACAKRFNTKNIMILHMRTHTGERPFTCSVCKKSFPRKHHMTTHMRIHTGEKPFACSFCAKRFNTKYEMMSHMRTHTGEKPFSCTVCDKTFRSKFQVSKHKCVTVMEAAGI
ncbi:gastrula zinc finger protein XlCGF57.1-like [Nerophis ophidion]|uniref:gastrula zinc finger protein XlCGF57.1-like n=1 Tax=Nerophis ophidion TaxID=159077 RepID=UPI002AE08C59|nr:gastrula zinc finger protein XlCGF57.1-like [Nerophis ophidion]